MFDAQELKMKMALMFPTYARQQKEDTYKKSREERKK